MCSNADIEQDGIMLMEKTAKPESGVLQWCRKCVEKTEAKVVLRKKDAYCKQCFLTSITHKFRSCLGKSKTMRPGDKVLIGFSGNENSVALLHLIETGLKEESHKKLMFEPSVIYIDEARALLLTEEEANRVHHDLNQVLQTVGYPIYRVPLDLSVMSDEALDSYLEGGSFSADDNTFKDLFGALTEITSKMDLLTKLRHNILFRVAKSLGCNKVFTAETANDLAMKLLSNVCLGRGAQLPFDVGFSDDRFPGVKLIRPLRDLSKKELVYYNVFNSITSVHVPSLSTKIDAHSSIQKLAESFLCELQDGFSSTLSTVFRVADKLSTKSENMNICPLCQAPVDLTDVASSSLSATHFSGLLSTLGPLNFDAVTLMEINSGQSCCGTNEKSNETCQSSGLCSKKMIKNELEDILCYGCYLIFKNVDMQALPTQLIRQLREGSIRHKMKKEIEDFLL